MFIDIEKTKRNFSHAGKLVLPVTVASLITVSSGASASAIGKAFDDIVTGSKVSVVLLNHAKTTEKFFKYKVHTGTTIKKDKDGNPVKDDDGNPVKEKNYKEVAEMDRQYEWGQALGLFYRSGKTQLGDSPVKVNFNLGYSHMFKLAASYPGGVHAWNYGEKIFQSEDCYWTGNQPNTGQYKCNDVSGYGKLALANVKFDWGKKKTNRGSVTVGDGFYNVGMITSATDDDALLSSYRGIMAKYDYNGYTFDGAYVIGFMSGNQDKMGDLTGSANYYDPDPIKYDNLYTMRVKKRFDNTGGYQVAYGEAKDYLRRFHTMGWYNLKLGPQTNLETHAQYYYNHKAGDLWDLDVENGMAAFDEYASMISYSFHLRHGPYYLMYGATKANAPSESKNGSFSYGFGNAKGYLKLPTGGGYHGFRRDGEEAWALQAKYDFRNFGLKDMSILYAYHWGDAPIKNKATGELQFGSEYEHTTTLAYEPKQGPMKGFVFNLRHTWYRPDEILGNLEPGDISTKADKTATKFLMSYMFNL